MSSTRPVCSKPPFRRGRKSVTTKSMKRRLFGDCCNRGRSSAPGRGRGLPERADLPSLLPLPQSHLHLIHRTGCCWVKCGYEASGEPRGSPSLEGSLGEGMGALFRNLLLVAGSCSTLCTSPGNETGPRFGLAAPRCQHFCEQNVKADRAILSTSTVTMLITRGYPPLPPSHPLRDLCRVYRGRRPSSLPFCQNGSLLWPKQNRGLAIVGKVKLSGDSLFEPTRLFWVGPIVHVFMDADVVYRDVDHLAMVLFVLACDQ